MLLKNPTNGRTVVSKVNPLMLELNPFEQRCLLEFFTGAFKF